MQSARRRGLSASRLPNVWGFVEEQISKSDFSQVLPFFGGTPLPWAEFKDQEVLKKHPWMRLLSERFFVTTPPNLAVGSKGFIESLRTLLNAPKLDLDRFLFLASNAGPYSSIADDQLEACHLLIRTRLATELRRWAESGEVLGALGMGPSILQPDVAGIGFGRNNSTNGGMGGMGGMGVFGGRDPSASIERGLELLALCSAMPPDQRPFEEIELLVTLMRPIAARASESNSLGSIAWSSVYTFDNEFLGERTTKGCVNFLNPTSRLACFAGSNNYDQVIGCTSDVVHQFWSALQRPANRTLWIGSSQAGEIKPKSIVCEKSFPIH